MKNFLPLSLVCLCIIFYSCQPAPSGGDLAGTYWDLAVIRQGQTEIALGKASGIHLFFEGDSVSGQSVCNTYTATFQTEETHITLSGLQSAPELCDDVHIENLYLQMLRDAEAYSVLEDRLILFSTDGTLTFFPMQEADIRKIKYRKGLESLIAVFPGLPEGQDLHLFPIVRVGQPGAYPYTGTLLEPRVLVFFDSRISETWNETGGDVFVVGQMQGLYICRVPGRYVSSDIALFRLDNDRLVHIETVAWAWCDEGWCNQQDAWLTDLNGDGKLDVVKRYTLTDDKGKIREERMEVLTQQGTGEFLPDTGKKTDSRDYPMARI